MSKIAGILFSIPLLAVLLSSAGCKKDRPGGVPFTQVDISININNPSYIDLSVPGGWLYLTGGSMGLIVYRQTNETFAVMDRHCPYQPTELCQVHVDSSEVVARDKYCCHSAFLITDGSVVQGPAALSLHRYNTTFNGTVLRIFN
jgi:nitrite reductase/ring-hydroxylating ferredoxin subunit